MTVSRQREKIFNIPGVVLALIVLLLAIHGLRGLLTPEQDFDILRDMAFVPARFTYAFDPHLVEKAFDQIAIANQLQAEALTRLLGDGTVQWWTPLTYAFLHGSWAHVGFNCLWFVAFGAAVARRIMAMRFIAFFVVTAIAGALMHYLIWPILNRSSAHRPSSPAPWGLSRALPFSRARLWARLSGSARGMGRPAHIGFRHYRCARFCGIDAR
jgi:membrane associated rhomboid family serine protease